jgi:hypothetical protein
LDREIPTQQWPPLGAAQRVTIDISQRLVHFITGLVWDIRDSATPAQLSVDGARIPNCSFYGYESDYPGVPRNDIWLWDTISGRWNQVEKVYREGDQSRPVPRFAFQMVYDALDEAIYIFGGNPNSIKNQSKRLNDLWRLRIRK